MNDKVLAVVVVYNRELDDVACLENLYSIKKSRSNFFSLEYIIIYDNSIKNKITALDKSDSIYYIHNPLNGGTRAAYIEAIKIAVHKSCNWVLFLDHDTLIPTEYFSHTSDFLIDHSIDIDSIGAIVPMMFDKNKCISPVYLKLNGRSIFYDPQKPIDSKLNISAISSGALFKISTLTSIAALPSSLSLDYLDHWIFREMRNNSKNIVISPLKLNHSLSLMDIPNIDCERYNSILSSEAYYLKGFNNYSFSRYSLTLFLRAMKFSILYGRYDLSLICFKYIKLA